MIDQADRRLTAWVGEVLGDVAVSLAPPRPPASGVHLYLFDLAPASPPQPRSAPRPLGFLLRYLVTVPGDDLLEAHRRLGEMLFAALADPEMEVELGAVPLALWQALGAEPQPAFVVKLPLEREREHKLAPRVREVVVEASPIPQPIGGR